MYIKVYYDMLDSLIDNFISRNRHNLNYQSPVSYYYD